MQFDDYQKDAASTALPSALGMDYLAPGLAAEAGEVSGKWAKIVRDKGSLETDEDIIEIKKELGDCLWFIALIAKIYNLDLSDVAQGNLDKLKSRQERGVIGGSGDNR